MNVFWGVWILDFSNTLRNITELIAENVLKNVWATSEEIKKNKWLMIYDDKSLENNFKLKTCT